MESIAKSNFTFSFLTDGGIMSCLGCIGDVTAAIMECSDSNCAENFLGEDHGCLSCICTVATYLVLGFFAC